MPPGILGSLPVVLESWNEECASQDDSEQRQSKVDRGITLQDGHQDGCQVQHDSLHVELSRQDTRFCEENIARNQRQDR